MFRTTTVGRLAGDPEIKYLTKNSSEEGTKVAKFGFITKRGYKKNGEDVTDFVFVSCFGRTADFVEKYLTQGYKIIIDGNFQTGSYVNKDGNTAYSFELVADNIEIVSAPKNKQGQVVQQGQVAPQQVTQGGYYAPMPQQAVQGGYYAPMPQQAVIPQGQPTMWQQAQQVVPQPQAQPSQTQTEQAQQVQAEQPAPQPQQEYATPVEDNGGFH